MNLTVEIPDEIAGTLGAGADLPRRVLEGFALEEYKSQRISKAQLRRLLGLETRYELTEGWNVWQQFRAFGSRDRQSAQIAGPDISKGSREFSERHLDLPAN